ncbi:MAG: 3'-5' exoribonuclease YhaM family protein [Armatimonadota bacterium]
MPKMMLADLTEGMAVNTQACITQKKLLPFKNKSGHFLALTLGDRSGTLDAKVFNNGEEIAGRIAEGMVVGITGKAESYQGNLQLNLDTMEPWDGAVNKADFMPAYAGDVAALEAKLDALIASLSDPDLSALIRTIFSEPELRRRYCEAPAGKGVHGAYLHGLLEHVVRQAELAEAACQCYPQANRDLVIAGVLLHDIGKIDEYSWELTIDITPRGRLLGHAVIGDLLVYERGRELGIAEETATRLRHLILSHHGTRDFGAVVLPHTLEAVILHACDNLEAKAAHCIDMLQSGDTAQPWTDYDRVEGHVWYRGGNSVEV